MDAQEHRVIDGRYGVSEYAPSEVVNYLNSLKERGFSPISCTVDGSRNLIRALKQLWPGIIIQRCMVHISRQGMSWCRQSPKRADAKKLRDIFLQVARIRTHNDRDLFLRNLNQWEKQYGYKIAPQPEKGRVFSDLKRARSMLIKAIPDMFHFLDNKNIPKSNNLLEGYYSRLKANYRNHRGLSPNKRENYFKWFFNLKPKWSKEHTFLINMPIPAKAGYLLRVRSASRKQSTLLGSVHLRFTA